MTAIIVQSSLILSQSWDDILQFIINLHNTGISWGAVITSIILWGKMMRNKRYHDRDVRMEKKIDAIMQKVGVECANLTVTESSTGSIKTSSTLRSVVLSVVRIAKIFTNYHITRRKTIMGKIVQNLSSKKLWAFVLLVLLNGLNDTLQLHLSPQAINNITQGGTVYIVIQGVVDVVLAYVKKGGTQNVPTQPTGDSGSAV